MAGKEQSKVKEARSNDSYGATAESQETIFVGSGNVFADLGYENAEEMLHKSKLVIAISEVLASKGLNQTQAAEVVGVDQPTLSKLLRGRTRGFTIDRLFTMLLLLGQDVEISIRPHSPVARNTGSLTVSVAHV